MNESWFHHKRPTEDVDDIDDGAADGVTSQAEYDSSDNWKYNQVRDVDSAVGRDSVELHWIP